MSQYQILEFGGKALWRDWLTDNGGTQDGIWIKIYKKGVKGDSVTYQEAVDQALCFGWIDGQRKKYDDSAFLQKFTPRRENSIWSKKNIDNIKRLESLGKLMPSGKSEVERAKKDGRWQAAYESSTKMQIPADFLAAVKTNPKTHEFFMSLSKTNLYHIYLQLHTAKKPETRERRFDKLLQMLKNKKKPV